METAEEVYVPDRDSWRVWLMKNYDSEKEIWLIYYKKHAGKPSISYDDSVEEALCFGWVDSIIKKIDDAKFARKFTPRTRKSRWSEANKRRVEKMIRAGKMMEAGFARIREAKDNCEWFNEPVDRKKLVIPSNLEDALTANKKALDSFNNLAESYKRNFVRWVDNAKKESTRKKHVAEAIGLLEQNQKLVMK